MSKNEGKINFNCKLVCSLIREEKKISDSVVVTKFTGEAISGLFKEYASDLEKLIFENRAWDSFATGEQIGEWKMNISDARSGETFVKIKKCRIQNITVAVGKENVKAVSIIIQHQKSDDQQALEAAVSTNVLLSLEMDTEVLPIPVEDDNVITQEEKVL